MMFRIILYAVLGFIIAIIFSPLVAASTAGTWTIGVVGLMCGAGVGECLNRMLGVQRVWNPEGLIEYEKDRIPWGFLPQAMRQSLGNFLRSFSRSSDEPR